MRYWPFFTNWLVRMPDLGSGGGACLDGDDIFCLWAFLACSNSEFNALAFCQSLEAGAGDSAEVSKNVWAVLLCDKAKTF